MKSAGPVSVIAGVQCALPEYRYSQTEITERFLASPVFAECGAILASLHRSAKVDHRHVVLPMEAYPDLTDFGEANEIFIENAITLGSEGLAAALDEAKVRPDEVDLIMSTTVTGIMAPSIEARIAGAVGLRPDVKRVPMFGLGCVAGVAGTARMHDYLRGDPDGVATLLSVELCSLTFPALKAEVAGLMGSALFGDGAGAVVSLGERRAERIGATGPTVIDSVSHLYPDSLRTMGWDVGSSGLKLVLSVDVPDVVSRYLRDDVTRFLDRHHLRIDDIKTWVSHPGGPKVIEAILDCLGLPSDALDRGPSPPRRRIVPAANTLASVFGRIVNLLAY